MLSYVTEEMVGYKLRELQADAGRLKIHAPRASHEERTPPPRVVVYRSRSASLEQLALEASLS